LNDPRVWALFARGRTRGVFQLEKQLGQDWSRRVKPKNIEELAALVSLLRPGPLESGIAEAYVKRKDGDEPISYPHLSLEPILKNTYGLMVFQEQILRIGIEIAGMSEEDADTYLRKGIGKKIPELIAKCKNIFIDGCKKKGIVDEKVATQLFTDIEKFQRYGFNKSHAISYAKIAYFSAYQKVHFSTEFYTSWLTYSDWKPDPKEEIYDLVQDARMNNVVVYPPDIRRCNLDFEVLEERKIVFGLLHIRGVGESAIANILKNQNKVSTFNGFLKCVKSIKRNVAESLIKAGACDCYRMQRTTMLRTLHAIFGRSDTEDNNIKPEVSKLTPNEYQYFVKNFEEIGIINAFQGIIDNSICIKKRIPTIQSKIEWLKIDVFDTNRGKSIWEKLYLGLNLTCSAADDYSKLEPNIRTCKQVYNDPPKSKVTMHVVLDGVRVTKTGEKSKTPNREYCYLTVSDSTGSLRYLVVWPDKYEQLKEFLIENTVLSIYGRKDNWNGKDQVIVDKLVVVG
jgi:DNA polymerase III alpha subunit